MLTQEHGEITKYIQPVITRGFRQVLTLGREEDMLGMGKKDLRGNAITIEQHNVYTLVQRSDE